VQALAENWWLLLSRGIASIIFRVLAFIWPGLKVEISLAESIRVPQVLADSQLLASRPLTPRVVAIGST